jgi:hypothetical protein
MATRRAIALLSINAAILYPDVFGAPLEQF